MFLQIVFIAVLTGSFVNGQIDTTGCLTYDNALTACNAPINATGNSRLDFSYIEMGLTSTISGILPWCGPDRAIYRTFITCAVDIYRACGTADSMKLVEEGHEFAEAFDHICNEMNNFDATCVNSGALMSCAGSKLSSMNITFPAPNANFMLVKSYYCGFANALEECILVDSTLANCAAKPRTKEIYTAVLHEIKPDECGAISVVYTSLLLCGSLLLNYIL